MPGEVVQLSEFATEAEAQIIRGKLEEEGVECFLANSSSATTLSYVGTAIGGVKLSVFAKDLDRALEILQVVDDHDDGESDWYCKVCDEFQESQFSSCWKCGADRSVVQGTPVNTQSQARSRGDEGEEEDEYDLQTLQNDVTRAWRSALIGLVVLPGVLHLYSTFLLLKVILAGQSLPHETARRLWGTAIINGFVFLAFYAFWIVYSE